DNIPAECDPLGDKIQGYKEVDHTTILTPQELKLGADHFYPFITNLGDGSPWNWWGFADLQAVVAGTNAVLGTNFSADTLHLTGLLTNPMMSAERGNTYLDTVFMVVAPRAYYAMGLNETTTSAPLLTEAEVQLQVSPVPSNGRIELRSTLATPMQGLRVVDLNGAVIMQRNNINTDYIGLDHSAVPPGIYVLDVYFKTGRVAKKVVFK
ncbi:MAG: T9SS type A sorting domain-containing protein, partial [Saprospiraceae bacterium]|nr:T9SS type A sorting domain-containing protein [Saprospiraceae bacterium]